MSLLAGLGLVTGAFVITGAAPALASTAPGAPTIFARNSFYLGGEPIIDGNGPTSDGGSPILSYTFTATPGGHSRTIPASAFYESGPSGADLTYVFSGLPNGQYSFTAFATNAIGDGPSSPPTSIVGASDEVPFPWGATFPASGDGQINLATATPSEGAVYALNEPVALDWDVSDASAVFSAYAFVDGRLVTFREFDPFDYPRLPLDTSTEGTHTVNWVTIDSQLLYRGTAIHYCVAACSGGGGELPPTDVPPGGTATTDPGGQGATTEVPVQTTIQLPETTGGNVEVTTGTISTPEPTNYSFIGNQINIATDAIGTIADPLVLTFTLEGSLPGADPATLTIVRTEGGNSVTLPLCTGALGTASPDPCMTAPTVIESGPASGDISVTVYTTHASDWNFAVHEAYSVSGFFQPVDNPPVFNSTSAGSAIPVKFSLGGDRGLAVFARGFPTSGTVACGSDPSIDAIEQTVTANASGLTFDAKTGQYTYAWKTQKTWGGTCRQLQLKFNDGSVMRANFKFK